MSCTALLACSKVVGYRLIKVFALNSFQLPSEFNCTPRGKKRVGELDFHISGLVNCPSSPPLLLLTHSEECRAVKIPFYLSPPVLSVLTPTPSPSLASEGAILKYYKSGILFVSVSENTSAQDQSFPIKHSIISGSLIKERERAMNVKQRKYPDCFKKDEIMGIDTLDFLHSPLFTSMTALTALSASLLPSHSLCRQSDSLSSYFQTSGKKKERRC